MGDDEFTEIFQPVPARPVMSRPPRMQASMKLIREVRDRFNLSDDEAIEAGDWLADKLERFGARSAQGVFTMDGAGPVCSWCGMIWPLCGHHHLSVVLNDDESDEQTEEASDG